MTRSLSGTFLQALDNAIRDADLSTIQHANLGFAGEMEARNMFRNMDEEPWAVLLRFAYMEDDNMAVITALDGSRDEVQIDQEAQHEPTVLGQVKVKVWNDEQAAERAAKMILPVIKDSIT